MKTEGPGLVNFLRERAMIGSMSVELKHPRPRWRIPDTIVARQGDEQNAFYALAGPVRRLRRRLSGGAVVTGREAVVAVEPHEDVGMDAAARDGVVEAQDEKHIATFEAEGGGVE